MDQEQNITVAKPLAPEDIAPGMCVTGLHDVVDTQSWKHENDTWKAVHGPGQAIVPTYPDPPLRVLSVCLPFVLVEDADGDKRQMDVRRTHFALLSADYGARAFPPPKPEPQRGEAGAEKAAGAAQAGAASDATKAGATSDAKSASSANDASGTKRSRKRRRRFVMRL